MYKELILEASNGKAEIQIQKPATLSDIKQAENMVGYNFPDELKKLLLEMNGDKWLFFAGNGCGDYYCYNINQDGTVDISAIYIWLHEVNETHMVAGNMKELIRRYYNSEI